MIFFHIACPENYLAVDGDVPGGGLTGGYRATLEECKNDCESRLDCNSLKYSPGETLCVLMNERTPTSANKYQDHQFCQRSILGNIIRGDMLPSLIDRAVTTTSDI